MLKGKQLIVDTRRFAKEDRRKSWVYTLTTLLILIASLTCTLLNIHIGLKILFSIFSSLVIVRLFAIYHDYMHEAILKDSLLAKSLFTLIGIYVLAPAGIWKRSHNYHHKFNSKLYRSSIGSYPVYTKSKFLKCSNREKRQYLFVRHPVTILFGYIFTFLYGMCIKPVIYNFSKQVDSFYALIVHFCTLFLLFWFFGWQAVLFFSIIPHFIASAIGTYLFYAQHNFPGVTFFGDEEWTYEGAALDSSSYMKLNPFLKWVTASIGYHHIHHLNARIPFYRLAEAMAYYPELQNPKLVSLMPGNIMACLMLKVWDHEKQQMTGLG